MNNLKIVAKHFSKNASISLEFKKDACPSTNGKRIILPENVNPDYLDVLIASLLHETSHIRFTNFDGMLLNDLSKSQFDCLNVLEDIRVDEKMLKEYPNAKYFYDESHKDIISKKEKLQSEPIATQVLKSLIFSADGIDPRSVYTDEETFRLFDKFKHYVDIAKMSTSTDEVMPHAKKLALDLFGELSKNNPDIKEKVKRNFEISEDIDEKTKEYNKLRGQDDENYKKIKSNDRNERANRNKARKESDVEKQKAYIERANKYAKSRSDLVKQLNDNRNKINDIAKDVDHLKREKDIIADDIRQEEQGAFSSHESIKGFDSLDDDSIKYNPKEIESTETLDEIIKNAIIARRDKKIVDDGGAKLNVRKLSDIYTNLDEMFLTDERNEYKTKVALVIDVSGSMDNPNDLGSRANFVVSITQILAEAMKKAEENNTPIEFSIYGFGSRSVQITTSETFQSEMLSSQYHNSRDEVGAGTDLKACIDFISEDMKNNTDGDSDKVAIILTDAEVPSNELEYVSNVADFDDIRFNYVAIFPTSYQTSDPSFIELFGENVIKRGNESNAVDMLTKIMLDFN